MSKPLSLAQAFLFLLASAFGLFAAATAGAASNDQIIKDSNAALHSLYKGSPGAKALGDKASGILVFPSVTKAGIGVVGGQTGDGVLLMGGKPAAFYNTSAATVGLQLGAQKFGYVLFFMSAKVLDDFRNSENFQVGVGPTVVVVDSGAAKDLNTLTGKADVYAMIFDQKGLMGGVGLTGSKVTKLKR